MRESTLNPLSLLVVLLFACLPLVLLSTVSEQLVPRDLSALRLGTSRAARIQSLGAPRDTELRAGQLTDTFVFRRGLRAVRYQVQSGPGNLARVIERPDGVEIAGPERPVSTFASSQ